MGMGGYAIDIKVKSQRLGSVRSLFLGLIAIFGRGLENAPPTGVGLK